MQHILWNDHPIPGFLDGWPLGNGALGLMVEHGIARQREELAQGYRHQLDLHDGVVTTRFHSGGAEWRRETIVSHPHHIAAIRVHAPRGTRVQIGLTRRERAVTAQADGDLLLTVPLADGCGGTGVTAVARLRILPGDGTISVTTDGAVLVQGTQPILLLVAGITDMRSFAGLRTDDPAAACSGDLDRATALGWDKLLAAHLDDYRAVAGRCTLELSGGRADLSTPARLAAASAALDPGLESQLFAYGRHLLISSSRPGGLPANLQDIWADQVQTPWNSDWHLNINVQMNYWPAAPTGAGGTGDAAVRSHRQSGRVG